MHCWKVPSSGVKLLCATWTRTSKIEQVVLRNYVSHGHVQVRYNYEDLHHEQNNFTNNYFVHNLIRFFIFYFNINLRFFAPQLLLVQIIKQLINYPTF